MSWWQALILGVVQGLTEFFPISSSGHLQLVPWLFDWNELESQSVGTAFDAALHLGTLLAVVVAVRSDLVSLITSGVRYPFASAATRATLAHGRLAWLYVLTAVPAAAVGVFFDDVIAEQLGGPVVIAVSLIGFGAVLWWADRRSSDRVAEQLSTRDALLIGAAQVLSLNPGTSRSGITMSAMRALGYGRAAAVRMSFVIGVPIIAGAGVWKVAGLIADGVPEGLASAMLIGVTTAAITGWLAITALQRLAARSDFNIFVVYRVALGIAVLGVVASGVR
ncbi:MAG: undecaprenyl-diphosphate phosphatase [Ilumatobacteraceae bacterium]|nr:undecaprenyl-diphosphate phosphatase [Ilumatobacteraceae bacterium]